VPSDLCAKHDDLLGGLALKALCLLSRQPYLASSERVLRELHSIAFHQGSSVPLPDLIHSLLAVPCPRLGGPKVRVVGLVLAPAARLMQGTHGGLTSALHLSAAALLQVCLQLGRCQRLVCPPLPLGPPPGELPLQPLLESLKPEALVGLFAAVLLEQRVLLRVSARCGGCVRQRLPHSAALCPAATCVGPCCRPLPSPSPPQSRHHWLLTVAAEGVVRLMHPLTYQHVFIPVMPCCLADYLEVGVACVEHGFS
jgi:hypothetical protein